MITLEPPRGWCTAADEPWRACGLSQRALTAFVRKAQAALKLRGEVFVLLTNEATLRRLNHSFRGRDTSTDVLSFPAPEDFAKTTCGDLAISLPTAQRQALVHGHTLADEVKVLLLHGLLHLAGMDHESDSGMMAAREVELRKSLRLKPGLVERTRASKQRVKA